MKRMLKRLLFGFGFIFGLMLLTAVIIAAFFEKQVGERLITEINKQLEAKLTIEEFDLSLLSGFPKASANLRKINLEDSMEGTLLEADNLSFRFGLLSLFTSKLKMHSVVIQDGALFIRINKRGKANYDILKSSGASVDNAGSDLALTLEEAVLEDVEVIYVDERSKQEMKFQVSEAAASGEFSSKQFSLNSFASMRSDFVELADGRYLAGKDLVYDAKVKVDFTNGRYEFEDVDVGVESNMFKVDGVVEHQGKNTDFDLQLSSNEGSLETMIGILPETYRHYLRGLTSRGTFLINATVKGRLNEKEVPNLKADFSLKNGRISGPRLPNSLKDVTFTASFNNGKKGSTKNAVFEISNFKGYFNRELIQSKLKIVNLDDPNIDFTIDGVLPLSSVYTLLENPAISDGDGEIEVKNFRLKGRYKDMISPSRIGRVKNSGVLEFDDAELTINGENMLVDKGLFKLQNNSLTMKDIQLEGAGSEIELNGKFINVLPVIFADEANSKQAELKFQSTLEAPKLDIDRLIALVEMPVTQDEFTAKGVTDSLQVAASKQWQQITRFLKGTFQAKVDRYNYNLIQGKDFSGSLEFINNEMLLKGNTHAMKGKFNLDGKVFFEDRPSLKAKVICEDIDLREFFRQAENFGQAFLQYKHLNGDLLAKLAINAYWAEDGTFLDDQLRVFGDINIDNGELIGFQLLEDFGNYIKIQDLRHIKFVNMRNWLEIRKGRIYLPAMFIQTNAANMTVSGRHSFKNNFEYNIKVNAGQIFFSKFKKYNPDKRPKKAKKKGWFNLYYRTYGNINNYRTKSDRKRVKSNFKQSDHRKREIQAALKKAFGDIDLFYEPSDWKDENEIPEYPEEESDDDPEFLEGFEEEEEEDFLEMDAPKTEDPKKAPKKDPKKDPKKKKKKKIPEPDIEEDEFIDFGDGNGG
ncbi:MAG: hypothetical protein AAF985_02005 [Bacteroidota bacterium]